ncbi:MAG: amidohydrolase family protein [Gemmataceae bacterium]
MPLVVTWTQDAPIRPTYYLDSDTPCYWYSATDVFVAREFLKLPAKDRERFYPFICGFNPTDRNAVDHVKRMIEWYPGVWKGIGEVMTRHDDLSNLIHGEKGRANHIALDPIYKLAAELDLPVSIHSNISSVWKREPIYLDELKVALTKHPKTRFIWCHAGVSRRIEVPNLTEVIVKMLEAHSNLYVDLSWVVYETNLVKNGKPNEAWVKLVEDHPDRFMIGSDTVGNFGRYHKEILRYEVFLDALAPATARKVVLHDNFTWLAPKRGGNFETREWGTRLQQLVRTARKGGTQHCVPLLSREAIERRLLGLRLLLVELVVRRIQMVVDGAADFVGFAVVLHGNGIRLRIRNNGRQSGTLAVTSSRALFARVRIAWNVAERACQPTMRLAFHRHAIGEILVGLPVLQFRSGHELVILKSLVGDERLRLHC